MPFRGGFGRVTKGLLCRRSTPELTLCTPTCASHFRRGRRRTLMNLLQQLEKEQVAKLSSGKEIPDFGPGDTVLVNYKVVEGERSRIQAYEGVCIGRAGAGLNENFTVRKISYGEGV